MNIRITIILVLVFSFFSIKAQENNLYTTLDSTSLYYFSMEDVLFNNKASTASKVDQKLSDIPASMMIITRENITKAGYKNLNEILENIPGFYSLGNVYFEGGTNFGVRGFSSAGAMTDFMILVNGLSQMEDYSNSFSTDKIIVPVEAIDRIEVVKGLNAVIYGSAAFMGAINIITNENSNKKSNVVNTSYGSNGTYRTSLHLNEKKKDLSFTINANVTKTNGLNVKYSDLQSDSSKIKSWGLPSNATTKGQLGGFQKYFEMNTQYKDFSFSILSADNAQGVLGSSPSANTTEGYLLNTIYNQYAIKYNKVFNSNIELNSRLSYYNYLLKGDAHWKFANSYNLFKTQTNGYDLDISALITPSKYIDFQIGVNNRTALDISRIMDISTLSQNFRNLSINLKDNENFHTYSVFAQSNIKPTENLILVAGLRAEQTNAFNLCASRAFEIDPITKKDTTITNLIGLMDYSKIQIIPRLASIYKFNNKNVLKLMYGVSIKRPSILENIDLINTKLYGLAFATMKTSEVNFSTILDDNVSISASLFHNQLSNLVTRQSFFIQNNITTLSENVGKMNTYGAELNLKYNLSYQFSIDGTIVIQNTENKTKNYPLAQSYSPNALGYINLNYVFNNINFCITGQYIDKMKTGWNVVNSQYLGQETPDYFVANFTCRVNNLYKKLYTKLHISNITNSEIRYPTTQNSTWTNKGMLGFGTRFQIELGCNL